MLKRVRGEAILIANVHRVFEDMSFVVRKPEDIFSHRDMLLYKTKDSLRLNTRCFFVL
jgi:hypothetical protein